jgi:hypothetical protein
MWKWTFSGSGTTLRLLVTVEAYHGRKVLLPYPISCTLRTCLMNQGARIGEHEDFPWTSFVGLKGKSICTISMSILGEQCEE